MLFSISRTIDVDACICISHALKRESLYNMHLVSVYATNISERIALHFLSQIQLSWSMLMACTIRLLRLQHLLGYKQPLRRVNRAPVVRSCLVYQRRAVEIAAVRLPCFVVASLILAVVRGNAVGSPGGSG